MKQAEPNATGTQCCNPTGRIPSALHKTHAADSKRDAFHAWAQATARASGLGSPQAAVSASGSPIDGALAPRTASEVFPSTRASGFTPWPSQGRRITATPAIWPSAGRQCDNDGSAAQTQPRPKRAGPPL